MLHNTGLNVLCSMHANYGQVTVLVPFLVKYLKLRQNFYPKTQRTGYCGRCW